MGKVKKMLDGKSPKDIAMWFLERALILSKEAKIPKELVIKAVNEKWDLI
jgi:hypothetical protein